MQVLELKSIHASAIEWLGHVSVRQFLHSISANWIFSADYWLLQFASAE